MLSKSTNHALLALVILGVIGWIFINKEHGLEGFNAYYYLPRRDPDEFVRHPLQV